MTEVEKKAFDFTTSLIKDWSSTFHREGYRFAKIDLNTNGNNSSYFSEIEVNIWKGHDIAEVFNLILYLQGKQIVDNESVESEANKELQRIYIRIVK